MTDLLRILISPLVWLAAFSAVYGLLGIVCGQDFSTAAFDSFPRIVLMAAYAFALLLQVALLVALYHPRCASPSGFVRFISHTTGWVGLVATIWSLLPVVLTSGCT